jgi:hypothetical protein
MSPNYERVLGTTGHELAAVKLPLASGRLWPTSDAQRRIEILYETTTSSESRPRI